MVGLWGHGVTCRFRSWRRELIGLQLWLINASVNACLDCCDVFSVLVLATYLVRWDLLLDCGDGVYVGFSVGM